MKLHTDQNDDLEGVIVRMVPSDETEVTSKYKLR
jgi:hypothetical protein